MMFEMETFSPPPFRPARLFRGGHLQTIAALRSAVEGGDPDRQHLVWLPDGDAIVVHENQSVDAARLRTADLNENAAPNGSRLSQAGDAVERVVVLFHGLGGCHRSPYMVRMTNRFLALGWSVYRVDMRGCGAARGFAHGLSHAGRSEDVHAALHFVAERHRGARIAAAGVSLGGNQLLRFAGRIGAELEPRPHWFDRLRRIAVVAPPIDLVRCSENMERFSRRPYNYFFIRTLLDSAPDKIRGQQPFRQLIAAGRPKTLFQLDDRLTAPLSGFDGAMEYYRACGAVSVAPFNPLPTLVLAAHDDPIVPSACFDRTDWPAETELVLARTGGHAGFIGRRNQFWMDECLIAWINQL